MPADQNRLSQLLVATMGLAFLGAGVAMFAGFSLAFAWCVSLILTLAVALGAARQGRLGPFTPFLVAALLVWIGAFTLMHLLPAGIERLVLGFPPATAAAMFLLWLLPVLTVTLPYGLLFERAVLDEAQVRELERRRAARGG